MSEYTLGYAALGFTLFGVVGLALIYLSDKREQRERRRRAGRPFSGGC